MSDYYDVELTGPATGQLVCSWVRLETKTRTTTTTDLGVQVLYLRI